MKMTITPADMKALETRFMEENHVPVDIEIIQSVCRNNFFQTGC